MVDAMLDRASEALELLNVTLPEVATEIPWLHFADAGVDDVDLAPADERRLGEWALEEHGSDFLFVTGYPMAKRPFYTHPEPGRPEYSNSFDLLFRGLEIVTGGQRLHRYDDYVAALEARGERPEPYDGYLQAFRYGMPPHGGFALGLERFPARPVGAQNVRETTLFPRDRTRLTP
jgi:nondiscriminating aspartyl-tRNA synthetase